MTHMHLVSGIDWWWAKKMILKNNWKYTEDYMPWPTVGAWKRKISTWYWAAGEGYTDYNKARFLYKKGRWKIS